MIRELSQIGSSPISDHDESLSLKAFADLAKRYHVAANEAGDKRNPFSEERRVEAEQLYDTLLAVASDALLRSPQRPETLNTLNQLFISSTPIMQGAYGPADKHFLGALCLRVAERVKPGKEGPKETN